MLFVSLLWWLYGWFCVVYIRSVMMYFVFDLLIMNFFFGGFFEVVVFSDWFGKIIGIVIYFVSCRG